MSSVQVSKYIVTGSYASLRAGFVAAGGEISIPLQMLLWGETM